MAVQVRLDLSNPVSIRDLRTFLNCMPQCVDETKDLRFRFVGEERLVYLAVEFPSASRQIEVTPSSQAA